MFLHMQAYAIVLCVCIKTLLADILARQKLRFVVRELRDFRLNG